MMEPPTIPDLYDRYYEDWLAGKRDVEKSYIMTGKPPVLKAPMGGNFSEFTRYYSSKLWKEYYMESGDLDD